MSEKITPPNKKVSRADGFKMPNADTTLTTPDPAFGRYWGSGMDGATGAEQSTLFGSTPTHGNHMKGGKKLKSAPKSDYM